MTASSLRSLAQLQGPQGPRRSPPAGRLKRTAAQAGLSAGLHAPEELRRQVVRGMKLARTDSALMWFNVCTNIANATVANAY